MAVPRASSAASPPTSPDAPPPRDAKDDAACQALATAVPDLRAALVDELERFRRSAVAAAGKMAIARLLEALERGDPLPNDGGPDFEGNTGLGIVSLEQPDLTFPRDVPFANDNAPRLAPHGCWGIVRTGLSSVGLDGDLLSVYYDYAIAFAGDGGAVALHPVPTYWAGIDGYNVLAVADLDRDGWEEALYQGANGWVGQLHDGLGGQSRRSMPRQCGRCSGPWRMPTAMGGWI